MGGTPGTEELQRKLGGRGRLTGPLLGWTLSSTQAQVTLKKAIGFAGELTSHLWIFNFVILPGSQGNLGRWDGKRTHVNGQRQL